MGVSVGEALARVSVCVAAVVAVVLGAVVAVVPGPAVVGWSAVVVAVDVWACSRIDVVRFPTTTV